MGSGREDREAEGPIFPEALLGQAGGVAADSDHLSAQAMEAFKIGVQLEEVVDASGAAIAEIEHQNDRPSVDLLVKTPRPATMIGKREVGNGVVQQRVACRLGPKSCLRISELAQPLVCGSAGAVVVKQFRQQVEMHLAGEVLAGRLAGLRRFLVGLGRFPTRKKPGG